MATTRRRRVDGNVVHGDRSRQRRRARVPNSSTIHTRRRCTVARVARTHTDCTDNDNNDNYIDDNNDGAGIDNDGAGDNDDNRCRSNIDGTCRIRGWRVVVAGFDTDNSARNDKLVNHDDHSRSRVGVSDRDSG